MNEIPGSCDCCATVCNHCQELIQGHSPAIDGVRFVCCKADSSFGPCRLDPVVLICLDKLECCLYSRYLTPGIVAGCGRPVFTYSSTATCDAYAKDMFMSAVLLSSHVMKHSRACCWEFHVVIGPVTLRYKITVHKIEYENVCHVTTTSFSSESFKRRLLYFRSCWWSSGWRGHSLFWAWCGIWPYLPSLLPIY